MRTLSVVFLAAVLFATLYPLTGWRLRAPGPFAFVAAEPASPRNFRSKARHLP
jgi:hypothetical protein